MEAAANQERTMRPTRHATAALLLVAFGAGACSKADETSRTKKVPNAAQAKLLPDARAQAGTTSGTGEDDPIPVAQNVTGSFADGEAAYRAKQYEDAMAIFAGYTERRPGNAWGHYMLALSAWKSGDAKKAEFAFEKALSVEPRHMKSLVNVGRVFIEQKRYDEAIDRLARAGEIDSESAEVQRLLGRVYHAQHRTDDAVQAYRRAIELNEGDAWSMNNLGLVLLDAKRASEALPLLEKAVELRQNVPEFHNNLGMALEHTGRFKAAASAYSGALSADPGYSKAKQNLARVEAVKGGPEKALAGEHQPQTVGTNGDDARDDKTTRK
jgi:tetratricopeptide (TPR) repeat protein